jgi:hypothetical protein
MRQPLQELTTENPGEYSRILLTLAFCAVMRDRESLIAQGVPEDDADKQTRAIMAFLAECLAAREHLNDLLVKLGEAKGVYGVESLKHNAERIIMETLRRVKNGGSQH